VLKCREEDARLSAAKGETALFVCPLLAAIRAACDDIAPPRLRGSGRRAELPPDADCERLQLRAMAANLDRVVRPLLAPGGVPTDRVASRSVKDEAEMPMSALEERNPRSAWDQFDGGAGRGAGDPVGGVWAVAPALVAVDGVQLIVDVGGGVDECDVTVGAAGPDVALMACPGLRRRLRSRLLV
jgi:hypothetical protein